MDMLIAAGGAGQETAAAVLRLSYLIGRPAPDIVVFDSDVAQRPAGDSAQTRMETLQGLDQRLRQFGASATTKVEVINPAAAGQTLVEQVQRIDDLFANTGYLSPDDEVLMSLLLDRKQRDTPVANGFHGEPAVGSLVFSGAWERGAFESFEKKLREKADAKDGLRVVLTGSVAGGVGTSVLPFLTKVLRHIRKVRPNVRVSALLQLPWFTLIRSGEDPCSREPDVTDAQFDRNCAGLIRGYLQDYSDQELDIVMLLGLPTKAQRVSHGGDRQLETHHYLCLCAGIAAVNLCSARASARWLGQDARGMFGMTLGTDRAPSAFDGPPAGPAIYNDDDALSLRSVVDVARSLKAYTGALAQEATMEAPSGMHHHSVFKALRALGAPQRIQEFRQTVIGLDNLHGDILRWLKLSIDSRVGGERQGAVDRVFDPPEGLDKLTSSAAPSVLRLQNRSATFIAPPRRLLRLPADVHPDSGASGRDVAWTYLQAMRRETLRRVGGRS